MPTSNDVVRPDPKDFIFTSKFSDKLVRKRGDIRGYDFSIDGCESCEIYLFDHTSQVFIDDCKDCTIFVGPVGGSVFLRDCSRVRLMALCQQLRTRDCRECELLLQIPGHPIVESSQHMIFGPLEIPKELTKAFNELMAEAGLAVARNEWASVFDFSKGQEPFPSDEHWRVMNEGEMRSRGKLNWHEEARACLGICVVARDVAPPKDEPGIELEEIEIESADSVRSSVASVELTEERGLCQRLLAGERVEVQDVRDCFKMPLEQSDKHVEEFLVELKLVTDLSSGNSSTTGDHVRDTLLTFFFQSPEDVADHIRTTMVNPQSAATFKKLQELNIVKLFVTGESCSARIMPLIRSSEMAKHVAIRAMLADQCRLAEDAPETYRAGVKALTTKDDRDEAVKALNYRTTKLMDDFEEHYHDSTHVKSVVSKHAILFRRILLWGQVADPETVGYIFEAAASASEDSLQLLSAVLTIDGIEETPAYELHGMSSLVKVVLSTSLSLLPAVLDIVAKSVERAAEIYEAEARDIEPSIVEVDLGDLREFVKKSLDPLCIRNAAIEIVEVTRPGASGNLVVAKAALKVLPGSFAVHVEDGFLPYGGHPGEPATISLTPAADSRYSNRYILPVIRATSLELKGIEEMHVEREYMDDGARYKIFPPKAHKGGCYAAARLILGDGENDVNCVWHHQVRVPPESDATTLIQVATEKTDGRRWREITPSEPKQSFTVMQWNVLAQGLSSGPAGDPCLAYEGPLATGTGWRQQCGIETPFPHSNCGYIGNDFGSFTTEFMEWKERSGQLISVILRESPSLLCLQEVDRFHDWLYPTLNDHGYDGLFQHKVRAPGLKLGWFSDGACVFYKREEWRLVENLSEIDTELRAPLAMALLERKSEFDDGGEPWKLLVASIHLKAGVTPEASKRREEQLKWVAEKVERAATTHQAPVLVCGDFNAEPPEASIQSIVEAAEWKSAYPIGESEYRPTTHHQRKGKPVIRRHIDYIWFGGDIRKLGYYELPETCPLLPSMTYPSDHLQLFARFMPGLFGRDKAGAIRVVMYPEIVPFSAENRRRTTIYISVKPSTCRHIREALVQTGLSLKKRYPQHELIVMLNAEDDQPYVAEPEKVGSWTIDALERSDISVFDVEDSRCQASLGFALAARPKSVLLLDARSTGCLPPVIAHFCSDCGVLVAKSIQALNEKIEKKILEDHESKLVDDDHLGGDGWLNYFKRVLN